ncbi:DMT family transporter [Ellagibacter isourolithinifaciens]|uniref:DMT family transporter n=1 Tax=Ellagibacter isourolithinifaciens TaxID=2137581 RepID=UPI003A948063
MRSMPIILGFLAGVGLPIQTSVNTRLRKKVGSPFNAALVSFLVGLLFPSSSLRKKQLTGRRYSASSS